VCLSLFAFGKLEKLSIVKSLNIMGNYYFTRVTILLECQCT
jgi:hypothetical protein